MRGMTRLGIVAVVAAGLLGLAACTRPGQSEEAAAGSTDLSNLSWDAQALESLGIRADELPPAAAVADPAPTSVADPSRKPNRERRWKRVRFPFRNVLHGEAVVQTDEGTKTVVVQRGEVTAITSTSVTVKSNDGFTLTWTFSDKLRVFERRNQIQPSAVAVGTRIGLAGEKLSGGPAARLIVIPRPR
jgi:hypothetical protein